VTGLVGHYTVEDLRNRLVIVITNLPPKKLVGTESKAMLLAGDDGHTTKEGLVKVLDPPNGAVVGDRVYLEGATVPVGTVPGAVQRINFKQWEKIVADLNVKEGKARYKDKVLVVNNNPITVAQLVDGSTIH